MLIPLIGALFTDFIFVGLGIGFPEITLASGIFTNALIGYAIWKYQLFNVSIEIAAENIISIMPDSLILIDAEGKIEVESEEANGSNFIIKLPIQSSNLT